MSYELYRHTTLGVCLQDALDEMIGTQQINPQLALRVLKQFDKSVGKALSSRVRTRYNFKGRLKTYRWLKMYYYQVLYNLCHFHLLWDNNFYLSIGLIVFLLKRY